MGFEPTTSCLGSKHSTAELHPPESTIILPLIPLAVNRAGRSKIQAGITCSLWQLSPMFRRCKTVRVDTDRQLYENKAIEKLCQVLLWNMSFQVLSGCISLEYNEQEA